MDATINSELINEVLANALTKFNSISCGFDGFENKTEEEMARKKDFSNFDVEKVRKEFCEIPNIFYEGF